MESLLIAELHFLLISSPHLPLLLEEVAYCLFCLHFTFQRVYQFFSLVYLLVDKFFSVFPLCLDGSLGCSFLEVMVGFPVEVGFFLFIHFLFLKVELGLVPEYSQKSTFHSQMLSTCDVHVQILVRFYLEEEPDIFFSFLFHLLTFFRVYFNLDNSFKCWYDCCSWWLN